MEFKLSEKSKKRGLLTLVVGIILVVVGFASKTEGDATVARFWSMFHINSLFFGFIALGATFFLAVQYVGFAGWSAVLLRVMSAFSQFLPIGMGLVLVSILVAVLHLSHTFHWMDSSLTDPNSSHFDPIIYGKKAFLNTPFFIIRTILYIAIWIFFAYKLRGFLFSSKDKEQGVVNYKKAFTTSVIFVVLFAVTSSTSAWDWVMSVDPHWFSTLFGWYTFSSYFVSALAFILLVTISLKKSGYLQEVNFNHLHDLGKFLFGFSIFWTYLFFSQFMLYWYSNIPEEVVYFQERWEYYKIPFWTLLFTNFVIPTLMLIARPAKRNYSLLIAGSIIILFGHWLDFFVMIMPGTVHEKWNIGFIEIGTTLVFLSIFLHSVYRGLSKGKLIDKNHPLIDESSHHHQ